MKKRIEYKFPDDFTFGVAAASYQIEGHPLADGASASVWHDFSHKRGKTENGDTGDIACDFYHKYPKDIDTIKQIGCGGFRFSVSWPRIVPEPNTVNQKGIDFYNKVVDEMLSKGIEPMCTLFHWDMPRWLGDLGGFTIRESVDHAKFYAEAMYKALGDRVKKWITINEPMVYAVYGYFLGDFPPGKKLKLKQFFPAVHHILLAHAEMVRAGKAIIPDGGFGISENQVYLAPYRQDDQRDRAAVDRMDQIINRMFIDPVFFGTYPEAALELGKNRFPRGFEKDLPIMKEPGDFVGINYYMRQKYKHSPLIPFMKARVKKGNEKLHDEEWSEMWEVYPPGLYHLLLRMKNEYGNPVCYITENGYPLPEEPGKPIIDDKERISYLSRHLIEASRAVEEGVNLKGYYVWTLMDNFEWAFGNRMRFGLLRTDFSTLERTWRESAKWYQNVIAQRAVTHVL